MRIVIADDEPIALERLRSAVACIPEVDLLGQASDGAEALALIRAQKPEVVILDIQMPGLNGLEVMASLQNAPVIPEVIFLTAFDQHAVSAFDLQAVDYVLKPVNFERLRSALRRAQTRVQARSSDQRFAELSRLIDSLRAQTAAREGGLPQREIWVKARNGLVRIPTETIDMIEAEGDYVVIHAAGASHLLKQSISTLEKSLDSSQFARVHRSTIVNLNRVQGIRRRGVRSLSLQLSSDLQRRSGPATSPPCSRP
jgi:DNA-binding LytR/AlgR family response regulator